MYPLKLLIAFLKVNIQQELAYRIDMLINMLLSLMWLGWDVLGLSIIFNNTATLGGWGLGEMIALLGVWRLVNTLIATLLWPNTERFNSSVRDGSLDYMLLQPVNSQFLVSFSRIVLWRLWDAALGAVLIVVGIDRSSGAATLHVVSFVLLIASGALIIYSLWLVLIACTFWFVKFDNNVTILQALMGAGRFPATVYPLWLRLIITFVVPVAVATTVPLQALRGDLLWWQVLLFLGLGAASMRISAWIWRAGVRRYSGASS